MSKSEPGPLLADDPIDGSADAPDRLGRHAFARHIVDVLDRVRTQSPSSVLGLVGDWGSGKSSVLGLTLRELSGRERRAGEEDLPTPANEPSWRIATFNPWMYSDLESLQAGFFAGLRSALPEEGKWSETRRRIGQFGKAIAPIARLIPVAQVDGAIEVVSSFISGDESAAATKLAAEKALREYGQPILIVMDDLDRLTPDELLLVFKLVRLVGRLPNVYYLLAYDEGTLLDVLARTDLVGASESRARDYLEKMIQVRLDLPPLREAQATQLTEQTLAHVMHSNSLSLEVVSGDRFATAYHDHLRRRLGTPRSINRYFAQVDASYALLADEVDFTDFLLITWIRTAEPGVYRLLQRQRDELVRAPNWAVRAIGRDESHAQALARWTELMRTAQVSEQHVDGVLAVLSQLFLPIRSAREGMDYVSSSFMSEMHSRRGIGHVDYFDRYFSSGIPEEDISDSVVRAAIEELGQGHVVGENVEGLLKGLIQDTARVCRKIQAEHQNSQIPADALLAFLGDHYEYLPDTHALLVDPRRSVQFLAGDLLPAVAPERGPTVLRRMGATQSGTILVAMVVARARHGSSAPDGRRAITWLDEALVTAQDLIQRTLDALEVPLESLDDELWGLIWAWFRIDEASVRRWLIDTATTKPGWTLWDILARLVAPKNMGSGPFPPLDLEHVEDLLGVDYVLAASGQELDALDESAELALEPTWRNRILVAQRTLHAERRRRTSQARPEDQS